MERSNRETKELQWFGYKDTFLALLHSPSHLLESFLHQIEKPHLWQRKPYTPNNTPQQYHTTITTSTQHLHTNLLHTYLLHTNLLHFKFLHNFLLCTQLLHNLILPNSFSSSHLFLHTFTTKSYPLPQDIYYLATSRLQGLFNFKASTSLSSQLSPLQYAITTYFF